MQERTIKGLRSHAHRDTVIVLTIYEWSNPKGLRTVLLERKVRKLEDAAIVDVAALEQAEQQRRNLQDEVAHANYKIDQRDRQLHQLAHDLFQARQGAATTAANAAQQLADAAKVLQLDAAISELVMSVSTDSAPNPSPGLASCLQASRDAVRGSLPGPLWAGGAFTVGMMTVAEENSRAGGVPFLVGVLRSVSLE